MKKEESCALMDSIALKGICHRGLHNDIYPENSLSAFNNAIINNLSFELDIHLTKDGGLVVCHDSNLKRVTNKEGIIEELTLEEIKRDYRLSDGSQIPSLDEVISLNNERVVMVIELKSYKHNSKLLAKKLKSELSSVQDKKKYIIISFFPRCLLAFRKAGFQRELLVGEDSFYLFRLRGLFEGLDISISLFNRAKVRKYASKHFVNCYTIDTAEKLKLARSYASTFTFEKIDI